MRVLLHFYLELLLAQARVAKSSLTRGPGWPQNTLCLRYKSVHLLNGEAYSSLSGPCSEAHPKNGL